MTEKEKIINEAVKSLRDNDIPHILCYSTLDENDGEDVVINISNTLVNASYVMQNRMGLAMIRDILKRVHVNFDDAERVFRKISLTRMARSFQND